MKAWTRRAFLIACAAAFAHASPALTTQSAAVVTPAALLPRADPQVLGWYSSATVGSDTVYGSWTYDANATTYTTSGDYFRRCAVSSSCNMYTGCSNGYMMAEGTSSSCGAGGSSGALFCSYHVLKTTLGATSERSWYWCDEAPLTGVTFYESEPSQPNTSSLPSSTDASTTRTIAGGESTLRSTTPAASASGSASSPTATQSTLPPSGGSSTNVGAIAGGVVGGVVGLALIGAGVFFLMYRRKKKHAATVSAYAPPPNQPGYPASPNMPFATAYQANEAKPVGVQEGAFYDQAPAPYPQGPYDPHMSYAGSPPPQEVPGVHSQFATMQAAPQELPTHK